MWWSRREVLNKEQQLSSFYPEIHKCAVTGKTSIRMLGISWRCCSKIMLKHLSTTKKKVLHFLHPVNSQRQKSTFIWSNLSWKGDYSRARPFSLVNQWVVQDILGQSARKTLFAGLLYTNEWYVTLEKLTCLQLPARETSARTIRRLSSRKPSLFKSLEMILWWKLWFRDTFSPWWVDVFFSVSPVMALMWDQVSIQC